MLNEAYPPKRAGNFPKILAQIMGVQLPANKKTGGVSLAKGELSKTLDPNHPFTQWLLEGKELPEITKYYQETQLQLFFEDHPEKNYVFNLKSSDHLGQLLFGILGETPVAETETGKPKVDEESLENYQSKYAWLKDLIDMKKLTKLLSTYVNGVLDRHINGVLYVSWKQFGTTSGRFSCSDLNLQNIPRVKEDDSGLSEKVLKYTNEIKAGFEAPSGYKIVNADYSQLEPCAFACASNEPLLQEVFVNKQDLYSSVIIRTFGMNEYSANKNDPNYLGKHQKEMRQLGKIFSLAAVYGASANRLKSLMNKPVEEVQQIIDDYFASYPKLKQYIEDCHESVKYKGKVVSRFGRVRHLPEAKEMYAQYGTAVTNLEVARRKKLSEQYWKMKNLLNLSTNHPIQATAAYIVNKAMITVNRKLKQAKIEGQIIATVHDEITLLVREDQAKEAAHILQDAMENTVKIEVPLRAEPLIGSNWAEAK
jgi:DNA polymerase-1